ncbi:unnamed protein product [Ilex paraguariensis]|uniref:Uncharacterized protein n=1 Tax=Ilex paraguariensis TaxID=185542 RepID=A0ABC8S4G0_9AQUA
MKREVRMDKNIIKEELDEKRASASDIAKTLKPVYLEKLGRPSPLFPPGTVIAAENTTVTISAATIVHDVDVSFIHFSPSFIKSSCVSVNNILVSSHCCFYALCHELV